MVPNFKPANFYEFLCFGLTHNKGFGFVHQSSVLQLLCGAAVDKPCPCHGLETFLLYWFCFTRLDAWLPTQRQEWQDSKTERRLTDLVCIGFPPDFGPSGFSQAVHHNHIISLDQWKAGCPCQTMLWACRNRGSAAHVPECPLQLANLLGKPIYSSCPERTILASCSETAVLP